MTPMLAIAPKQQINILMLSRSGCAQIGVVTGQQYIKRQKTLTRGYNRLKDEERTRRRDKNFAPGTSTRHRQYKI
jgi:hypothetical protein